MTSILCRSALAQVEILHQAFWQACGQQVIEVRGIFSYQLTSLLLLSGVYISIQAQYMLRQASDLLLFGSMCNKVYGLPDSCDVSCKNTIYQVVLGIPRNRCYTLLVHVVTFVLRFN